MNVSEFTTHINGRRRILVLTTIGHQSEYHLWSLYLIIITGVNFFNKCYGGLFKSIIWEEMAPVANLIRTSSGTSQSRTLVCAIIPVIHAASTEFEIGAVLNYWLLFNSTPHNHLLFHQPLNLRHHRHLFQMKWCSRGLPDIIAGNWWMQVSRWKDVPNRFPMAPIQLNGVYFFSYGSPTSAKLWRAPSLRL